MDPPPLKHWYSEELTGSHWARGQEAWTLGLTLLYSICKVFGKSVKFQTLQSAHLKECD